MDTQGLLKPDSTQRENERIFGLSTLLSSIQILNIKDVLYEDPLEYLEVATSLTKLIASRQITGNKKPFQRLFFLNRDWSSKTFGFSFDGDQKYINDILRETGDKQSKLNAIRRNLRDSFDEISCFFLISPGINVLEGRGEWDSLNDEFVGILELLIESLVLPENLVKKSFLGKDLTGFEFQNLIKAYFKEYAGSNLPSTENILQMSIDSILDTIYATKLQKYKSKIENFKGNESTIKRKQNLEKSGIIEEFNSETSTFQDRSSVTSKTNSLSREIDSFTTEFNGRDENKSKMQQNIRG